MLTIFPNKKGAEKANIFLASFRSVAQIETGADIFKTFPEVRDATFNRFLKNDIRKKEEREKNKKKSINSLKRFIWHKFLKYYV